MESFSDYPDGVKNNAQRGIDLNKKVNNKCATQVGKIRAKQLSQGKPISKETLVRMFSYLSRAQEYYDEGDWKHVERFLICYGVARPVFDGRHQKCVNWIYYLKN
jgi:hypothetical protein